MALRPNPLQAKQTKDEANYRLGSKCMNCIHFIANMASNMTATCELVQGAISPEAVCDLFESSEPTKEYMNKEFFDKARVAYMGHH